MSSDLPTLQQLVQRCQTVMSHAWMVRTFVKHSEEAEEFPELMGLARAVFDTSRALETRVNDPPAYFRMLRKKLGKLQKAAVQFRDDARRASTHMNFQQAVLSIEACVEELQRLLARSELVSAGSVTPPPNVSGEQRTSAS